MTVYTPPTAALLALVLIVAVTTSSALKVHGGWSDWSDWSQCSDDGDFCAKKTRVRTCTNPAPLFGGQPCHGGRTQTQFCNSVASLTCPVHGGWSDWEVFAPCSGSCPAEYGWRYDIRFCNNPPPSRGGADCDGVFMNPVLCKLDC